MAHRYSDYCTCPDCTKRWQDSLLKNLGEKPEKTSTKPKTKKTIPKRQGIPLNLSPGPIFYNGEAHTQIVETAGGYSCQECSAEFDQNEVLRKAGNGQCRITGVTFKGVKLL